MQHLYIVELLKEGSLEWNMCINFQETIFSAVHHTFSPEIWHHISATCTVLTICYTGSLAMALKKSFLLFCLELQRQVDQYFMSMVLQRDIHIDVSTKDYPKIYLQVSTETQEVRTHDVVE